MANFTQQVLLARPRSASEEFVLEIEALNELSHHNVLRVLEVWVDNEEVPR